MNETVWDLLDQYKGTLTLKLARQHRVNPNTLKRLEEKGPVSYTHLTLPTSDLV